MKQIACVAPELPAELELSISRSGVDYEIVDGSRLADDDGHSPETRWAGALVVAIGDMTKALAQCRTLRRLEVQLSPLVLVVTHDQIDDLALRDDLFDDFCVMPVSPSEIRVRFAHVLWKQGRTLKSDVIRYGPLQLNLDTYQAAIDERVMDLTYMEYELLKFLVSSPKKVFTRETLLSRVWGYEYYGGARTVDVHIRRLRAKLGEEHAHLIQTVRSVGYRFGEPEWSVDHS
ncbi:MAG: winged helix-turn-helix domain-containing protein [Acidimicrobiales bacterium]